MSHKAARGRVAVLGSAMAAAFCVAAPVAAAPLTEGSQPATPGPVGSAPAGEATQVGEIIVTAQRRNERLQDTPVSVQVFEAAKLKAENLDSLSTVVQLDPSVHISGLAGGGRTNEIFIRGVGSGQNPSFDQSVGVFIDDVYHGRSRTTSGSLLDLDRVEVLKGPQSTFFGNNAIAGAFNIVTRKPDFVAGGEARALYGEDGQYAVEAAVGGPVTDKVAFRAAVEANGLDGWLHNTNTGSNSPQEDNLVGRLSVLWKPTSDLDVTLKLEESSRTNHGGWASQVDNCPPPAPFVAGGFCGTRLALSLPTGLNNNVITDSPGSGTELESQDYLLAINYHLFGGTLSSVTGYYAYTYKTKLDADFLPASLFEINNPETYHQFSQELRYASPAGHTFEYLVGAYYQTDALTFSQDFTFGFLSPTILSAAPFAPLRPYLPLAQTTRFHQPEDSEAVFGALTWNVTPALKITGGLRSTWVNKNFTQQIFYGQGTAAFGGVAALPANLQPLAAALKLGTPGALAGDRSDHDVLPSVQAQYTVNPHVNAYFTYSQGFKAGGFNGLDTTGVAANLPYAPEHVDAYEVGLKSELFQRRVLLNLAAFLSDYSDLQVTTNVSNTGAIVSTVRNAASVESKGVELEAQWRVGGGLTLGANATYLNSRYERYPDGSLTLLQTFCRATYVLPGCAGLPNPVAPAQDLSGRPTQFAPAWSGAATATYTFNLADRFRVTAEGQALYSTNYFLTNTDDPLLRQDGYVRLDARLTFEPRNGWWAVDLIAKNLTNQNIITSANGLPTATGPTYATIQEPRNIAGQVRVKW